MATDSSTFTNPVSGRQTNGPSAALLNAMTNLCAQNIPLISGAACKYVDASNAASASILPNVTNPLAPASANPTNPANPPNTVTAQANTGVTQQQPAITTSSGASSSAIDWLVAWVAMWLILAFMADAGAGDLAVALAAVAFATVLFHELATGKLSAGGAALKGAITGS